jgi:hypothetical protein
VTDVRVDPRSVSVEIDFEIFLDRLMTFGLNVSRFQQRWRGSFRSSPSRWCSGAGHQSEKASERRVIARAREPGRRVAGACCRLKPDTVDTTLRFHLSATRGFGWSILRLWRRLERCC